MSSLDVSSGASSPLRLAANRRNAQKSTGPRSAAGKRRVALNALRRSLCPEELEKRLRTRGQDPREFRHLHRDLIAIFHPKSQASFSAVALLAEVWWEKARRIQSWVGAGHPNTTALDERVEETMQFLMYTKMARREPWRTELTAVLGRRALPTPAAVRRAIEERLQLFGAKQRKYPVIPQPGAVIRDFLEYREALPHAMATKAGVEGGDDTGKTNPNKPIEVKNLEINDMS